MFNIKYKIKYTMFITFLYVLLLLINLYKINALSIRLLFSDNGYYDYKNYSKYSIYNVYTYRSSVYLFTLINKNEDSNLYRKVKLGILNL